MSRLSKVSPEAAKDQTAEIYGMIKSSLGSVPNLFQTLGNNPKALGIFLGIGGGLRGGKLSGAEQEAIALTVAQYNSCNYCLAAHSTLGKMNGLSESEMIANRQGGSENTKRNTLIALTSEVVANKGNVTDKTFNAFKEAGYTEAHIPEILLAVIQNIYTNYFNNFNHTEIDFPEAPKL